MRNILLNWLPWILMVKRPGHNFGRRPFPESNFEINRRFSRSEEKFSAEKTPLDDSRTSLPHSLYKTDLDSRINQCLKLIAENPALIDRSYQATLLTMQQIYFELKYITQRMKRDDEAEERKNDWKYCNFAEHFNVQYTKFIS